MHTGLQANIFIGFCAIALAIPSAGNNSYLTLTTKPLRLHCRLLQKFYWQGRLYLSYGI